MTVLVKSYTQEGYRPTPALRLSDVAYGEALQCFVPACADIVPIDPRRRVIYLARRSLKPMAGKLWWIGGRMAPHETREEAALRNLTRETGLMISPDRLTLAAVFNYRWADRAQPPEDLGCQTQGNTFTVELTEAELAFAARHLEAREYEHGCGLTPFDREGLVEAGVFPALLDFYDHVFPALEEVECGSLAIVATDARREIREFEFGGSAFQDFVIKDGSRPLGNHFHRAKFEIFYFLEGSGTIRTAQVNEEGEIIGPIKQFKVGPGSVIRIPPYHTHRFDLAPGTRFVAFSSKPFDASDMITCPIPVA